MKQHQPKVLIAGCSGFLGAQLVRESLKRQWKVIGISSRPLNPSNSPFDAKSSDDFKHLKLNLLDMSDCERLRDVVGDVDACVHSIGSLFDSTSYKSFKSNQRLLCSLISSFNSNKNDKNGEGKGQESALKTLNFDSAVNLLDAFTGMSAAAKKCKSFVYISTETHLLPCPWQRLILDSRYWKYKREFESILTDTPATFEKIVIRPGFMYSDDAPLTLPVGTSLAAMNIFKTQILPSSITSILPSPPARPLNVQTVASFTLDVLQASLNSNAKKPSSSSSSLQIFDTRSMLRPS